jgi:predicted transcriptional regulator
MDIKAEKLQLVQMLLATNNEKLIRKLKNIFSAEQTDWFENLTKAEKKSVEQGLKDIESGNAVSHKEVVKKYRKWM